MEEFIRKCYYLWLFYSFVLKYVFCLFVCFVSGKLVDETGEYKYMYIACGAIVFLASVWLLIGNTINYRLLAKEKKLEKAKEETYNKPESRETEPLNTSKQCDVEVKGTRPGRNPSERETNI